MTPEEILGTVSTEIDGSKYEMQMLGGHSSWRLLLRITKILGPSLGKIFDLVIQAVKAKGETLKARDILTMLMGMDLSSSFVNEITEALVDRMDEKEIEHVIGVLSSVCAVSGKVMDSIHFDSHFRGRPWSMMKWLGWAIQAQYSGFGSGSTNVAGRVAGSPGGVAVAPAA